MSRLPLATGGWRLRLTTQRKLSWPLVGSCSYSDLTTQLVTTQIWSAVMIKMPESSLNRSGFWNTKAVAKWWWVRGKSPAQSIINARSFKGCAFLRPGCVLPFSRLRVCAITRAFGPDWETEPSDKVGATSGPQDDRCRWIMRVGAQ